MAIPQKKETIEVNEPRWTVTLVQLKKVVMRGKNMNEIQAQVDAKHPGWSINSAIKQGM